MLAELRMELEINKDEFGYYQSSIMQGVLMEQIDSNYAEKLHNQGLHPYSQYVEVGEKICWIVKTLEKEAYEKIIKPLLDESFYEFEIKKKNIVVKIRKKEIHIKRKRELLDVFYNEKGNRFLTLEFLSPTAFKSNGNYIIIPELRYIYQSLMNKYSAVSSDMEMYDEETLEQLVQNSHITRYRLRSTFFPMESIKIPAFRGEITIKITGTETMAKYARLLVMFGEYSGIGIKTAMGMGAIRLREGRENT